MKQKTLLDQLTAKVRELYPTATTLHVSTTDQNVGYGFVLDDIKGADGVTLLPADERARYRVYDELWPMLGDLDWDGVVGEDKHGNAVVAVR